MVNIDYTKAYNYIRERILSGEYPRGFPLKPDILAKEIGISRTPIRDALRVLDADGLVTIQPRIGASVRSIAVDEYREICGMRLALEIFAAGLAAKLRTDADLNDIGYCCDAVADETERLIQGIDPQKKQTEPPTSERLVREDIHFHMAVAAASKNKLIAKELMRNHLINRIVSISTMHTAKDYLPVNRSEAIAMMRSTVSEHRLIYEAIKRQDTVMARNAMEMHLHEDAETLLRRLARNQNDEMSGNSGRERTAASGR